MRRSSFIAFARELLFFALFLAAAIALTWPLIAQLPTLVSDTGDPLLNTWIIDWDCYALTHRGAALFQADIFYPGKFPLAYSENMLGVAIVMLPWYLAGVAPLVTYNIAMLIGFAFSGYGAFVLARKATGSWPAGIVGGLLYGFVPFRFDHLAHVQIVWGGWIPIVFAALLHFRERPTRLRAALLCGALVMNGITNIHWLLFGFFAYGAAIVLIAFAQWAPASDQRRFWIGIGAATIVSIAVLYPLLHPYQVVSKLYAMKRDTGEVLENSAVWTDWLVATDRNAMYGQLPPPKISHSERHLFPGLVAPLLTLAALLFFSAKRSAGSPDGVARRPIPPWVLHALDALAALSLAFAYVGATAEKFEWRLHGHRLISLDSSANPMMYFLAIVLVRLSIALPAQLARFPGERLGDRLRGSRLPLPLWIALLCIAIGILGSFGLNAFFHTYLYRHVEAFRSIRAVSRWSAIAYLGFSLAAAYGAVALAERLDRRKRALAFAAVIVLAANDVRTSTVWGHAIPEPPPVTQWLAGSSVPAPIVELPIQSGMAQFYYLLWATAHHKTTMNGTSGFEPPVHWRLNELTRADRIAPEFTDILVRNRCAIVVVHGDFLAEQAPRYIDWLQRETRSGRLVFLRRFDHGPEGDWVFALREVAGTAADRLRAPETPDAAGFTPSQNLARMLEAKATYNGITFGKLDIAGVEASAPFRILGWALSPYSVREVIARFECGKEQFKMARGARGDVSARWPWYPDPLPGFAMTFERRPRGVRKFTDLEIEIVDGRGEHTKLPSVWVSW